MNQELLREEELLDFEPIVEPKDLADLGWIARRINANNRQAKLIEDLRDREVEKILACCNTKIDKLNQDSAVLESMAQNLLKSHGYAYQNKDAKKYECPGIGKFVFTTTRESVDSTEYEMFDEDTKKMAQADFSDFFNRKLVITPDKKIIMDALRAGKTIAGFHLNEKKELFQYKEGE